MTLDIEELSSRLKLIAKSQQSGPCPYKRIVAEVTGEDEATGMLLDGIIYDYTVSIAKLHREIRNFGYPISKESIANHRRGDCTCKEESN